MTSVTDPAYYETHYFVLPPERDAAAVAELEGVLNAAGAELAGRVGEDAPPRIALHPAVEDANFRLAVLPRRPLDGAEVELDVRVVHDAVMLRLAVLRPGTFQADRLPDLALPRLKSLEKWTVNYLGVLAAWYGEVADPAGRPAAAEALANRYFPSPADPSRTDPLTPHATPVGGLVGRPRRTGVGDAAALDAAFVGGPNDPRAAFPFLVTLPELALYHLKLRNSADRLRNLLAELREKEKVLGRTLDDIHPARAPLAELKSLNDRLTTLRWELLNRIDGVERELRAVRINRRNFARAVTESPFRTARGPLTFALARGGQRHEVQAQMDLGGYRATLRRTAVMFDSLDAADDYYQAVESRKLNTVVILLAAVQAVGLIPASGDEFKTVWWLWRVLLLAAPFAVLAVLGLWYWRRPSD